jgi:hypothetical protein
VIKPWRLRGRKFFRLRSPSVLYHAPPWVELASVRSIFLDTRESHAGARRDGLRHGSNQG